MEADRQALIATPRELTATLLPDRSVPARVRVGYTSLLSPPSESRELRRAQSRGARELAGAMLGVAPTLIGSDASRCPTWPEAWIGSIAHCGPGCVVAVAPAESGMLVGIDIEDPQRLVRDAWTNVFTPDERQWLDGRGAAEQRRDATVMFAAKEAAYKALFPVAGGAIGFFDCSVVVHGDGGWMLTLHRPPAKTPAMVGGRWTMLDDQVVALCSVPSRL